MLCRTALKRTLPAVRLQQPSSLFYFAVSVISAEEALLSPAAALGVRCLDAKRALDMRLRQTYLIQHSCIACIRTYKRMYLDLRDIAPNASHQSTMRHCNVSN